MLKLIKNSKYTSEIQVIIETVSLKDMIFYLENKFALESYDVAVLLENFKEYIADTQDFTINFKEYINSCTIYDVKNKEMEEFMNGESRFIEMTDDNGNRRALVERVLTISDINDLLVVHGETTTPRGVENIYKIVEEL